MKELVEFVVKYLVDYPDEVVVNEVGGGHSVVLEIKVNPDDIRKIIGKQGRNIDAIRSVLQSVAAKHGKRAILEIIEPANRVRPVRDASNAVERATPVADRTPAYDAKMD